ncbi:hypothetical protein D3C83_140070 [compost metagenome]
MPGRAVRQLRLLEEKNVTLALGGEMIGDRAADGTASDDDDAGMAIGVKGHGVALRP